MLHLASNNPIPGESGIDAVEMPLRDLLPLTWYPLLCSSSLAKGRCLPVEFLGKPWVVFRDEQGGLGLIERYCSHMGADLSRGRVRDGKIECGLHGWRFDRQGRCPSLEAGAARDRARLAHARVGEWAGIVFAHPAGQTAFDLEGLTSGCAGAVAGHVSGGGVAEDPAFSSIVEMPVPFHWLLAAVNTFDPSHYGTIHHRRMLGEPELFRRGLHHLGIRYTADVIRRSWFDYVLLALGAGRVEVEIDCWGACLLVMRNMKTGFGLVISLAPGGPDTSRVFLTAFCDSAGTGWRRGMVRGLALDIARRFGVAYLKADIPYLRGMRPHPGVLLPGKDDVPIAFWDYYRSLPKVDEA